MKSLKTKWTSATHHKCLSFCALLYIFYTTFAK